MGGSDLTSRAISATARTTRSVDEVRAPYASSARSNQTRATRHAIVTAAAELFVEQGYAATTIGAVAERAGVGRKTVFDSVGGKGALLKLAWDWAIAGDDEPIPMTDRPAVQAMLAERDPRRLVRMWVDMLLDIGVRTSAMTQVVLAAADVDAEAAALRELIRAETLAGATAFVRHLSAVGGLRADLTVERAAGACWALVNSLLLPLLTIDRGWSPEQYGEWLVGLASATLLEPPGEADRHNPAPVVRIAPSPAEQRYEAFVDDRAAGSLAYDRTHRLVLLTRTQVVADPDVHGVADALVRRAFEDVRAEGQGRVVPLCDYVRWWVSQHPGYASMIFDAAAG